MTKVIVVTEGGCISGIFSDDPTLDVEVLDHDEEDEPGEAERIETLMAECEGMTDVAAKMCPNHCGNRLQLFLHNCPNTSVHPEIFGCPACDDDCPHCSTH